MKDFQTGLLIGIVSIFLLLFARGIVSMTVAYAVTLVALTVFIYFAQDP